LNSGKELGLTADHPVMNRNGVLLTTRTLLSTLTCWILVKAIAEAIKAITPGLIAKTRLTDEGSLS
jgi:hypothetical protein